jgi:hypothetical protein
MRSHPTFASAIASLIQEQSKSTLSLLSLLHEQSRNIAHAGTSRHLNTKTEIAKSGRGRCIALRHLYK